MDPAVRFWLLILSLAGTVSAAVMLVVSAFLPGSLFGTADTLAYLVSVFVALVSLGVLVWSLTADTDTGSARPGAR
jgi:predicted anti-sigma-YlaC factor YlaD